MVAWGSRRNVSSSFSPSAKSLYGWAPAGLTSLIRAPLPPNSDVASHSRSPLPPPTEELIIKVDWAGPRPPPSHRRPHPHIEAPPPPKKAHLHEWKARGKVREKIHSTIHKGNMVLALVYLALVGIPVLYHLAIHRTSSAGCQVSSGDGACVVWPHVTLDVVCAWMMFVLTQVVVFNKDRLKGAVPSSFRPGLAGTTHKWAARWNCINVVLVVSFSMLTHHLERFTDRPLALVKLPSAAGLIATSLDQVSCNQTAFNGMKLVEQWLGDSKVNNHTDTTFEHCVLKDSAQEPDCFVFGSRTEVASKANTYFGWRSVTMFMLGCLAVSVGEIMKLRYRQHYLAEGFADLNPLLKQNSMLHQSPVFKTMKRQSQKLAEEVRLLSEEFWDAVQEEEQGLLTKAGRAKRREVKDSLEQFAYAAKRLPYMSRRSMAQLINQADLHAVTWPALLQAVGFTLWIPLDYINLSPCLGVNGRMNAKLFLNTWPDVASPFGIRYLMILHFAALLFAIAVGVVVVLSRRKPQVKKYIVLIVYAMLALYIVEFGDVGFPQHHGRHHGISLWGVSLWRFLTPQMLQSVLTALYIVEAMVRALLGSATCCVQPSDVEQQKFDELVDIEVHDALDKIGDCAKDHKIVRAVARHAYEITQELVLTRKARAATGYQEDLILPIEMQYEQPPPGPFHADEVSDDELAGLKEHVRHQDEKHHHHHHHHHHSHHHHQGDHQHHEHHHHQHAQEGTHPLIHPSSDAYASPAQAASRGADVGELCIRVIAAHGLTDHQGQLSAVADAKPGLFHSYVTVQWDSPESMMRHPLRQQRTHTVKNSSNPEWNRSFIVPVHDWNDSLALEVRDERGCILLGRVVLRPTKVFPARSPVTIKERLQSIDKEGLIGELELEATFSPSAAQHALISASEAAQREVLAADEHRDRWYEQQHAEEVAENQDFETPTHLQAPPDLGTMCVWVVRAENLTLGKAEAKPKAKPKSKRKNTAEAELNQNTEQATVLNAYVNVQLEERSQEPRGPRMRHRMPQQHTETINNTVNPEWNSLGFQFPIDDWSHELVMELCNESGSKFVGRLVVPLFFFRDNIPPNIPIRVRDRLQDVDHGELEIVVSRVLDVGEQGQSTGQAAPEHAVSLAGLLLWQVPVSDTFDSGGHQDGNHHMQQGLQPTEVAAPIWNFHGFPIPLHTVPPPNLNLDLTAYQATAAPEPGNDFQARYGQSVEEFLQSHPVGGTGAAGSGLLSPGELPGRGQQYARDEPDQRYGALGDDYGNSGYPDAYGRDEPAQRYGALGSDYGNSGSPDAYARDEPDQRFGALGSDHGNSGYPDAYARDEPDQRFGIHEADHRVGVRASENAAFPGGHASDEADQLFGALAGDYGGALPTTDLTGHGRARAADYSQDTHVGATAYQDHGRSRGYGDDYAHSRAGETTAPASPRSRAGETTAPASPRLRTQASHDDHSGSAAAAAASPASPPGSSGFLGRMNSGLSSLLGRGAAPAASTTSPGAAHSGSLPHEAEDPQVAEWLGTAAPSKRAAATPQHEAEDPQIAEWMGTAASSRGGAAAAAAQPAPEDLEKVMQEVAGVTGADDGMVLHLLEQNGWDSGRAINAFYDM